ncbi:hypothetical protein BWQ96_10912 [Gracilariopsis chorda]|uniref:Uncharacterized protein n=1 Tax=Gracilariopsis chorda TaxID=448386 RepID=A0A2V3IBB8_9FLOR|nr:hypothetical protein BWQ96_10912 [Gracilariopsis chorda]|eukprot:PXF39407.1 hypothetical protein BWQ96_10912 [Gracilariopsis chorda]
MKWNTRKSVVLSDSTKGLKLTRVPLQQVQEARYLGVTITREGVTNEGQYARIDSARARLGQIIRWCNTLHTPSMDIRRRLIRTAILQLADYGAHLVKATPTWTLKRLEKAVSKWTLGTHTHRQPERMMALAGIPPHCTRQATLMDSFCRRKIRIARQKALEEEEEMRKEGTPRRQTEEHVLLATARWNNVRLHPTLRTCLEANPICPQRAADDPSYFTLRRQARCKQWEREVNTGMRRTIPFTSNGSLHIWGRAASDATRRIFTLWYLNSIPVSKLTGLSMEWSR